jgi:hypothetical protein
MLIFDIGFGYLLQLLAAIVGIKKAQRRKLYPALLFCCAG